MFMKVDPIIRSRGDVGLSTTPRAPRKILQSHDKFADHFLKWLINFERKKNIFFYISNKT